MAYEKVADQKAASKERPCTQKKKSLRILWKRE